VPLNLTSCPPKPFFAVILTLFTSVNLLAFLLEFGESSGKLIALIEKLSHLGE